ncbi:MAG: hypothetical protein ACO31E_07825, partial [Phycisphaerales bacterium]
ETAIARAMRLERALPFMASGPTLSPVDATEAFSSLAVEASGAEVVAPAETVEVVETVETAACPEAAVPKPPVGAEGVVRGGITSRRSRSA